MNENLDLEIRKKLMHAIVEMDIWRARWGCADGTNKEYADFRHHAIKAQEHARNALALLSQMNGWEEPAGIFSNTPFKRP